MQTKKLVCWLVALALVLSACSSNPPDTPSGPEPEPAPGELTIIIDEGVMPATPEVAGMDDDGPPRPVGALVATNGTQADLVLNEVTVAVKTQAELDAFLARWDGEVIDDTEKDEYSSPDDPLDYLVRINPAKADTSPVAADLLALEPHHKGEMKVSSEEVLQLLAVVASEAKNGLEVSPNWLFQPQGIAEGEISDAPNFEVAPRNAFEWYYMNVGSAQDTGVGLAWQLLNAEGKLGNKVEIMILDGGFSLNEDFPEARKIRQAPWNESNRLDCGDNECPWHGTQVAVTAMGQLDNEFGTAGPAGPVGELLAVGVWVDSWKNLRRAAKVVDEERPDIVNMSFSGNIPVFKDLAEGVTNRLLKSMKDRGALIFAAAGNFGEDVDTTILGSEAAVTLPCESPHVVCVGGMATDSSLRHPNSNFGTKEGNRSVEIYGPFCPYVLEEPSRPNVSHAKTGCGTSYASPFVAGIAALVKAADPSLTHNEIWAILKDTAHHDGVGLATGNKERVNAFAAVNRALGSVYEGPTLMINTPDDGDSFDLNDTVEFTATALDFQGTKLPVLWESSLDGILNNGGKPTTDSVVTFGTLSAGTHVITARASDLKGSSVSKQIEISVGVKPPLMTILSPASDTQLYGDEPFNLIGASEDPNDFYQKLSDSKVTWLITRKSDGASVLNKTGHVRSATLPPGDYKVTFKGDNDVAQGEATLDITVEALPPGQTPPNVTVTKPGNGAEFTFQSGQGTVDIDLNGFATDAEDGSISGLRMRWLAIDEQQKVTVLCQGSNFEGSGGGLAPAPKDCKTYSAEIVPKFYNPGATNITNYTLRLEAKDNSGLIASDEVGISIKVVTP